MAKVSRDELARRLGVGLGVVFIALGIAETVRLLTTGDGGLAFWFGTLCGGGTIMVVGTLRLRARPRLAMSLTIVGAVAGSVATAWTLILPIVAMTVVTLRISTTPKVDAPVISDGLRRPPGSSLPHQAP